MTAAGNFEPQSGIAPIHGAVLTCFLQEPVAGNPRAVSVHRPDQTGQMAFIKIGLFGDIVQGGIYAACFGKAHARCKSA